MRYLGLFFLVMIAQLVNGQGMFDCEKICIVKIEQDTVPGYLLVTIYNGDSIHINYPTVVVTDLQGDTIGNPAQTFDFFAHPAGDTVVHRIPFTLNSLPVNFGGTVYLTDQIYDSTCSYSYPMGCSDAWRSPDCNDLEVTSVSLDTAAGLMNVTIFNNCVNCHSGMQGPVYCEMKVYRAVAPFDTLGAANCYCFVTPNNQSSQIYTIMSSATTLPPISDMVVSFFCGNGMCDTLEIDPFSAIAETATSDNVSLTLFPVPATGQLNVIYPRSFRTERLRVISAEGKELLFFAHPVNSIDVSALASGVYFLVAQGNGQMLIKSFVKTE